MGATTQAKRKTARVMVTAQDAHRKRALRLKDVRKAVAGSDWHCDGAHGCGRLNDVRDPCCVGCGDAFRSGLNEEQRSLVLALFEPNSTERATLAALRDEGATTDAIDQHLRRIMDEFAGDHNQTPLPVCWQDGSVWFAKEPEGGPALRMVDLLLLARKLYGLHRDGQGRKPRKKTGEALGSLNGNDAVG